MTTTPAPAATTINHLDFDIPCSVIDPTTGQPICTDPATWWVIANSHCRPDTTTQAFWCTNHHDRVMASEHVRCRRCEDRYELKPLVIRTERIR